MFDNVKGITEGGINTKVCKQNSKPDSTSFEALLGLLFICITDIF